MRSPYEWGVAMWGAVVGVITFASNMLNIDMLWSWAVTLDKLAALAWAALVAAIGGGAAVAGKKMVEKWFGKKDKTD